MSKNQINKDNILFWIALCGFFGINGIDLIAAINEIVLKLGNGVFIFLFLLWLYAKQNK